MPRRNSQTSIYIGIDNGVSGSIGIVGEEPRMFKMPTKNELSYTKEVRRINRIDLEGLMMIFGDYPRESKVFLERPMVNPKRFQATTSALRALEATLIGIELRGLSVQYIDSRQWQKVMLPGGLKGGDQLKAASHDIGIRLFPQLRSVIEKQGDADSILMAEWARRSRL